MMRALWTAASGMTSQQTNVDVIANNLANVNTVGYKKEAPEFKSLLYQTIQTITTSANGNTKPIGAQVGLGVRNSAITSIFTQGTMTSSNKDTDFAIEGDGFFAVRGTDGQTYYTRNGSFNFSVDTNGTTLCNSDGLPVLDTNGNAITLDGQYDVTKISIDSQGNLMYPDETKNAVPIGVRIGLVQFTNPSGLEKESGSLYSVTAASGAAVQESTNPDLKQSKLRQNFLEASNVQVVDEMVNLIVAQRAYEMNSKAIQAADDMLSQANSLKR